MDVRFREGKKIGWRDGVRALWCMFQSNLDDLELTRCHDCF